MKHLIGLAVASAFVVNVNAQSSADGYKLVQYGKYQSAVEAMKKIADNNPEAAYVLGLAELKLENYAGARAAFSKHPADYRSQAGQALLLLKDNKIAEGEKILDAIVDKAKKKEWEKYRVAADAINYSNAGNISKAIEWYKKAVEINPEDADTYIALGDAYQYRMQNVAGDAMDAYQKAEKLPGNKSFTFSKIASLWLRSRTYDLALDNFTKAKDADVNNPLPYKSLASAYQRAGQYKFALENVEKYYALSDKANNDKIDYANILILSKEYGKAESILNELFSANVNEPTLHRAMAYSQYETKKFDLAKKSMDTYFADLTDKSKLTADDYLYSGKINAALSQSDTANAASYFVNAQADFDKALVLVDAKDKKATYNEIGDIFKDAGAFKQAGEWYGKVISEVKAANAKPSNYEYFNYGLYSYYGSDYETALAIFTEMREAYPDQGTAIYWQARSAEVLDPKGDKGGAEKFYLDWLSFTAEGYEHKDNDKIRAYQYLSYYYYNIKKDADAKTYIAKILELDATNKYANSMNDYYKKIQK